MIVEVAVTDYIPARLNDSDLAPDAAGFHAVVTGHTHGEHEYRKGKTLYLNREVPVPKRSTNPSRSPVYVEEAPWRSEVFNCRQYRLE